MSEKAGGTKVPLEDVATSAGAVDSAAELAKTPVDKLAGSVDTLGGQAGTTTGLVDDLATAINNLPSEKYIDIYYRIHVSGTPPKGRQHGGPVEAGGPYMIGETGPEIFVSPLAGRIIPHGQMNTRAGNVNYRNIGGDTYNVYNYNAAAAAMSFAEIQRIRRQRLNRYMGA
ncbi:MAG: hypothetical protein A2Z49_05450 [Chloroflexi bacterium RBG_19FT_COMBO_56_12]|nr:MAG: hypothetical protein A2Z49_05450 [Chloroflexi bacterium RBG_19FT_COMBO_56_12]